MTPEERAEQLLDSILWMLDEPHEIWSPLPKMKETIAATIREAEAEARRQEREEIAAEVDIFAGFYDSLDFLGPNHERPARIDTAQAIARWIREQV